MKFTFKKYITQLIILNVFLNLIAIIFLILSIGNMIAVAFSIFIFFCINAELSKNIYKTNSFLKSQTSQKIINLERDMSNSELVYDSWYLTDEYMFSIKEFEEVSYQDIIVIEGGLTLVSAYSRGHTLGYKQKIYLKSGKIYKLKSKLDSSVSDLFKEIVLKKNPNVYFGIIEDYLKITEKQD